MPSPSARHQLAAEAHGTASVGIPPTRYAGFLSRYRLLRRRRSVTRHSSGHAAQDGSSGRHRQCRMQCQGDRRPSRTRAPKVSRGREAPEAQPWVRITARQGPGLARERRGWDSQPRGRASGAEGEARMRSTGASTLGSNHSPSGAGPCPATEGVGFEPTWVKTRRFSRPVQLAALPPLHLRKIETHATRFNAGRSPCVLAKRKAVREAGRLRGRSKRVGHGWGKSAEGVGKRRRLASLPRRRPNLRFTVLSECPNVRRTSPESGGRAES